MRCAYDGALIRTTTRAMWRRTVFSWGRRTRPGHAAAGLWRRAAGLPMPLDGQRRRDRAQPFEDGDEGVAPGPVAREVERPPAGGMGEAPWEAEQTPAERAGGERRLRAEPNAHDPARQGVSEHV